MRDISTAVSYKMIHVSALADCDGFVSGFNIYPDPNSGSFTVEIPQPGNNAVITILDVTAG